MTMDIIDKRIYSCNEAICKNIESLQANERGLLSQNILSQLRNFLECVFLKIYVASGNSFIESGDFAGKTIIPFATSGSSSISNAEKELQTNYPGINWGKGRLLNGASRETVKQWIKK